MTAGRATGARLWTTGMALIAALAAQRAQAELQITEIMGNPLSSNDDAWEWIEVRNTGATEIDLDGYFIDRLGDTRIPASSQTPSIALGQSTNTKIPAGGVAVIYDGDLPNPLNIGDYNDAVFRQAWGLAPSVPLIAAAFNFGGGLTNAGNTSLGFWPTFSAYEADLVEEPVGTFRVGSFNNATFGLDFRTAAPTSFPTYPSGASIRWNGTGDWKSGTNWGATTSGTTSVAASALAAINSAEDVGNPGVVPSTLGAPESLFITEIMYDPRSPDEQWEWVEIFNGGPTINFGATPYVLQDTSTVADLTAANITSGTLATGGVAVLYDSAISPTDFAAAWDPGGTRGTLFIPVANFPELANSGDTIAIWDSLAAYDLDKAPEEGNRATTNAATVQVYDDEAPWTDTNGDGSTRLVDLTLDPADGASWEPSNELDGVSFNAVAVGGTVAIHPGGDLGTPGVFGSGPPAGVGANFDGLGVVDDDDLAIWRANFGMGTTQPQGDADGDGDVDGGDFLVWQRQLGTTPTAAATVASAVPEPAGCMLACMSLAAPAGFRRRHR